jgi:tetratricopeptide (TPR) repeat protein
VSEIEALRERARAHFAANRIDAAREAFLLAVAHAPDDPDVLLDAGTFFVKTGAFAAARTIFERAVERAPQRSDVHAALANVHFGEGAFEEACARYARALECDPENALAHQGMSYALARLDRDDEAEYHRRLGFAGRALTTAPYRGTEPPIDVLLVVAAAGGTIYTDRILDDTIFRVTTLVADVDDADVVPLPACDVAVNALADADRVGPALERARRRLAGMPVVNAPERVLQTGRAANARRLATLGGVSAPRAVAIDRTALERSGATALVLRGFRFPLLLRALGYQTGRHFLLVDEPGDVPAAVAALPGPALLALDFVDLRDARGLVRKYRMMAIDRRLYPLHAATSSHWKVHYVTADMGDPAHRDDDAAFLADPERVLGPAAIAALERIVALLDLDYVGIDFGLGPDGRVVVFEANATMIVLPPGPDPIWDYRREPVARVITAAQAMVRARAGR